jgi:hypothetical protein
MSSPFSFDNWDLLLDPSPSPLGLTSSPSVTPSSAATSGEFQPFVNIGLTLSGGGDRKTFALLYGGNTERLCCSFIGSQSNAKFCIRAAPCGIAAHARKFEVAPTGFYLKENKTRAFVNPSFKGEGLPDQEIRSLLAAKHTLKELASFFTERDTKLAEVTALPSANSASVPQPQTIPENLTIPSSTLNEDTVALETSFVLDSPRFLSEMAGIFSVPPQLSFDVDDEDLNPFSSLADSQSADLVALLKEFHHRFVGLKTKWVHTFLEVDTSHTLLVKDLRTLHDQSKTLKVKLLAAEDLCKKTESSISFKLQCLEDCLQAFGIKESTHMAQLEHIQNEVQSCRESLVSTSEDLSYQIQNSTLTLVALDSKLTAIDKMMKEFDKCFSIIFPILKDVRHSKSASTHLSDMQQQLHYLSEKVNSMDQEAWHQISGAPSPTSVTHTPLPGAADLQDLQHQIKVLQHCIVEGGIKIGTKVFQSFEDVQPG